MSGRVVIDTSVVFKWFVACGESGLGPAWSLLNSHRRGDLMVVAPSIVVTEIANLLSYLGIHADDANAFLVDFEQTHVVLFETTYERAQRVLKCAFENRMTVYDASFLTLAQEFECPLVTADRRAFGSVPASIADVQLIL
jgi:predicted nucleic acid-binding protein